MQGILYRTNAPKLLDDNPIKKANNIANEKENTNKWCDLIYLKNRRESIDQLKFSALLKATLLDRTNAQEVNEFNDIMQKLHDVQTVLFETSFFRNELLVFRVLSFDF
jgi:hypothetical protein